MRIDLAGYVRLGAFSEDIADKSLSCNAHPSAWCTLPNQVRHVADCVHIYWVEFAHLGFIGNQCRQLDLYVGHHAGYALAHPTRNIA